MIVLRSRLAALERERNIEGQVALRKDQVSAPDRSLKIRTYNYNQVGESILINRTALLIIEGL